MNTEMPTLVRQHYEQGGDTAHALARAEQMLQGLGEGPFSAAQLAGMDQFHIRGLPATVEMARWAQIAPGSEVLDAGSGFGGPSRYLADTVGCRVTGVDLAPSFVAVAQLLAERAGLSERVHYEVGDITALPFADARFDLVWTQHVVMNITDRAGVYRQFRRVLKPQGRLLFYDVIAADGHPELHFPVPWAADARASHLLTQTETVAALQAAGFVQVGWQDATETALAWFGQLRSQPSPVGAGSNLVGAVIGPAAAGFVQNFSRNLGEGRARLAMGEFRAVAA